MSINQLSCHQESLLRSKSPPPTGTSFLWVENHWLCRFITKVSIHIGLFIHGYQITMQSNFNLSLWKIRNQAKDFPLCSPPHSPPRAMIPQRCNDKVIGAPSSLASIMSAAPGYQSSGFLRVAALAGQQHSTTPGPLPSLSPAYTSEPMGRLLRRQFHRRLATLWSIRDINRGFKPSCLSN